MKEFIIILVVFMALYFYTEPEFEQEISTRHLKRLENVQCDKLCNITSARGKKSLSTLIKVDEDLMYLSPSLRKSFFKEANDIIINKKNFCNCK